MLVTRRQFVLIGGAVIGYALCPALASNSETTDDRLRRQYPSLYRELAVADATNIANRPKARAAIYGNGGADFDLVQETAFRRDRIITLASLYELNGSKLSNADKDAMQRYVQGLQQAPDPSLADKLWRYLGAVMPDRDTTFDIIGTGEGIGSLLVSIEHPIAGAALGIASLLTPYINKGIPRFWPEVRDADEEAVRGALSQYESGLLDPNLPKDLAIKEFLGIPFGTSSDELLARSPERTRNRVKQAAKLAESPSKIDSLDAFKDQSDQLTAVLKEFRQSIVDDLKKDEAAREASRAQQQYIEGEVRAGIYLGSTIIGDLFGAKDAARVFSVTGTESFKVWQLIQGFNSIPPTVGSLALTGGFVSAGLAIGQALAGIPSAEEVTQKALASIQLAISTLRQEMHERFDRIERNQRQMMEALDDIFRRIVQGNWEQLARLRQMRESLNGLRSYVESQDRQAKIDELLLALDQQKLVTPHVENAGDKELRSKDSLRYLTQFVNHAVRVSRQPAFTHREVTSWNQTVINDVLETTPRPDLAVALLDVFRKTFAVKPPAGDLPNPVEWARGTHVFLEAVARSRKELPPETHSMVKALYDEGRKLREALPEAIDQALCNKVTAEYEKSFDEVKSLLALHYAEILKANASQQIYSGVFPWFAVSASACAGSACGSATLNQPTSAFTEAPADRVMGPGGFSWRTDRVIFFRDRATRAIMLNGSRNPLDVAIQLGLVDAEVISFRDGFTNAVGTGHALHRHDDIKLHFKAGKWEGMTTTRDLSGENGITRRVYDRLPNETSWDIYAGTQLQRVENGRITLSEAIGADVGKFLTDLRDEGTKWHSELRKRFLAGIEGYLTRSASSLEHFKAVGNAGRFLASFIAWGHGAPMAEVAYLCSDTSVTLSSTQALAALASSLAGDEAKIGPSTQLLHEYVAGELADAACASMTALLSTQIAADSPKLAFQIIEGTMVKLQGLAYHHRIALRANSAHD